MDGKVGLVSWWCKLMTTYLHKDQVYGMPAINVVGLYNLYLVRLLVRPNFLGQSIEPGESKQVDPTMLSLVMSVLWPPKPCLQCCELCTPPAVDPGPHKQPLLRESGLLWRLGKLGIHPPT